MQVDVRSLLTLYPAESELLARVLYRATGGPIRQVVFSLPEPWAEQASLEVPGRSVDVKRESRDGATYWTIRLDEEAWCSQSVLVRSRRPYSAGRTETFPQLTPRGRGGAVRSALRIANATGQPIVTEGSGVRPVHARSLEPDSTFPEDPPGIAVEAFTPLSESWRLAFRLAPDPDSGSDDALRTSIELATVACSIDSAGAIWGQSDFLLAPRPGAFLGLSMSTGTEPLAVLVDGVPSPLLRGKDRTVIVPLGPSDPKRVSLVWRVDAPIRRSDGSWSATLPEPLSPINVPTGVTIHAIDPDRVSVTGGRSAPSLPSVAATRRVQVLARRLLAEMAALDRSSAQLEASLVRDLVQFELHWRTADRSARGELAAAAATPMHRASNAIQPIARSNLESLQAARAQVERAARLSGLDELVSTARAWAGLPATPPTTSTRPNLAPSEIVASEPQIRLMGKAADFWCESLPQGQRLQIVGRPRPAWPAPPSSWPSPIRWVCDWFRQAVSPEWVGSALLGLTLLTAFWWLARLADFVSPRLALAGVLLLILACGAVGSPCALALLAGLAIGRYQ
jgi:hypothetical protein